MWKWPTVKLISRFPFSSLSLQSALQESSFPFSFAHRTSWWWWLWWRWTREREKESKKQGRMKNTKVAIEVLYVGNERREEQWLRSRSGWGRKARESSTSDSSQSKENDAWIGCLFFFTPSLWELTHFTLLLSVGLEWLLNQRSLLFLILLHFWSSF